MHSVYHFYLIYQPDFVFKRYILSSLVFRQEYRSALIGSPYPCDSAETSPNILNFHGFSNNLCAENHTCCSLAVINSSVFYFVTVTVTVNFFLPDFTVILAFPAFFAVITPFAGSTFFISFSVHVLHS